MADNFGANPAYIKWDVVRGDTSVLRVEFYDRDEDNPYNTSTWTYVCTAYNPKTKLYYYPDVVNEDGYVTITADPDMTSDWGSGVINELVAQLDFDLQVTIDAETVWTPVIGIISVIGDISERDV